MKKIRSNKGFTLVEVILLIVILSFVSITFGGTLLYMIRISTVSFVIKKSTILASNKIEDFHAYKANNSPDTWITYLQNNFNGSESVEEYTITSSNSSQMVTIPQSPNSFRVYYYQVDVSNSYMANPITFKSGFTLHQFD